MRSFKSSGNEYTDGEIWNAVKRGATKLAEWEAVKETLADETFDKQGRSLTKQIARVEHYTKEIEAEQKEFTGDGFDFQHAYVIAWTEDGEGRRRVAWAMSGDEAVAAMDILTTSITRDQKAMEVLSREYRSRQTWRGAVSWQQAVDGASKASPALGD